VLLALPLVFLLRRRCEGLRGSVSFLRPRRVHVFRILDWIHRRRCDEDFGFFKNLNLD
jgi:hypothetical protein